MANRLSRDDPLPWEVIDEVDLASRKPASKPQGFELLDVPAIGCEGCASADGPAAGQIIVQRRSLLACDRRTSIAAGPFYKMLARLEAEAAGIRATGIGCFFDDPVHQVFGLDDLAFQSLCHFTVGGTVEDPRLTTLLPYGARADGQERGMDLP